MAKKKSGSWPQCRKVLSEWPQAMVLALIEELYKLGDDNRRFLHTRLLPSGAEQSLDETKAKLERMLSVSALYNNRFRHIEVKRFLEAFAKSAGDPYPVADLLITDLECGFEALGYVGDHEPMVNHLFSIMNMLGNYLSPLDGDPLARCVERLKALADNWGSSFGYGLSDEVVSLAIEWSDQLGQAD